MAPTTLNHNDKEDNKWKNKGVESSSVDPLLCKMGGLRKSNKLSFPTHSTGIVGAIPVSGKDASRRKDLYGRYPVTRPADNTLPGKIRVTDKKSDPNHCLRQQIFAKAHPRAVEGPNKASTDPEMYIPVKTPGLRQPNHMGTADAPTGIHPCGLYSPVGPKHSLRKPIPRAEQPTASARSQLNSNIPISTYTTVNLAQVIPIDEEANIQAAQFVDSQEVDKQGAKARKEKARRRTGYSGAATEAIVFEQDSPNHSLRRSPPQQLVEEDIYVENIEVETPREQPMTSTKGNTITTPQPDAESLSRAMQIDEEADIQAAQEVDLQELQKRKEKARKEQNCRRIGCCLIAMSVLVIIISVVVFQTRDPELQASAPLEAEFQSNQISSTTPSNTLKPSAAPTDILEDFIATLPDYTKTSLEMPLSPQNQALEWLRDHVNQSSMPHWRKEQLFALASFYYSFAGEDWPEAVKDDWMYHDKSECFWYSSDFGRLSPEGKYDEFISYNISPCNEDEKFRSLVLADLLLLESSPTIPPEISMLTDLVVLALALDNITTSLTEMLPSQIFVLTQLTKINFFGNSNITGTLSTELGLLTSLDSFHVTTNALTGMLPTELGLLSKMTQLGMSDNAFSGPLPSELGLLTSLDSFHVFTNALTGMLPTELGLLSKMTQLDMSDNAFSGPLPSELGLLTMLDFFQVFTNALTGVLPTELGLLSKITQLDMSDNAFSGPLPLELQLMSSLSVLSFHDNSFNGSLPTELGLLSNMTELYIAQNSFSGFLPSELGKMGSLSLVSLHDNSFNGSLPTELGLLTQMVTLSASKNDFSGPFPTELFLLTSLSIFYANGNSLTGSLPTELGHFSNMTQLEISRNFFAGPLPSELGLLTNVTHLVVSTNALSGSIPSELGLIASLNELYLSDNALTGLLPTELGLLNNMTELMVLSANALSGPIPTEIGLMALLRAFDVFENTLTGPLPTELGLLTQMTELILRNNAFSGQIPTELGLLTQLTVLSLRNNLLSGTIPTELGLLASKGVLGWLRMENNSLFGMVPTELCKLGLSFDCHKDGEGLCGCCWCPCLGTERSNSSLPCSLVGPDRGELWPGEYPTPINSTNIVTINIFADQYPEETTLEWSLETASGEWNILISTKPQKPKSLWSLPVEVTSNALYKLTIYDLYSDGFCCDYGVGWATVTTAVVQNDDKKGSVIWETYGTIGSNISANFWVDASGTASYLANMPAEDPILNASNPSSWERTGRNVATHASTKRSNIFLHR